MRAWKISVCLCGVCVCVSGVIMKEKTKGQKGSVGGGMGWTGRKLVIHDT